MFLFFCAFITNKYLKLSVWRSKPFKTKQQHKKQTEKKQFLQFSSPKQHFTEKTFKTEPPSLQ